MDTAPYYFDFDGGLQGVHRTQHIDGLNKVRIAALGDRLLIVLEGEPSVATVVDCLETGLRAGWLHLSMLTLVDMRKYVGVIDWGSLKRLREMADWAAVAPEKSAVAYVVPSNEFGAIIKIIAALFGRTRHKAFAERAAAVAWLTA